MAAEYWLYGDIPPGPIKASVITDIKTVPDIIKKFKNKVFSIGPYITKLSEITAPDLIDRVISLALASGGRIATSSPAVVKALDAKGIKNYDIEFLLELARKALKRGAELIVFVGHFYSYEWLILNYLKHYAPDIKTLTLEPYAQPNATWTLASLPLPIWYKNICSLEEMLKKGTA
jgi:CO dehydrogenase/acetyl-CoA synthase epsilon subunit